ncbi:hypothetical protein [Pseudonocardia asaccharolytica]|uniref:Uncharacterized protein n=1 Tax=Pseudonocardia asaccharolytica DSM 44247 = NBRC 16224 TaxID=1123024 RepID=A0A511D3V1_9PSEU|nr:hypothetical protein [Pseudonocardia asaccharolytica]GEL19466.1 hypothetical protein PA7_33030 [Pseudonocardia asaccharolytica DSM 44247 = NBRC 16224]
MRRLAVWVGCVAVALLVAWYAGGRFAPAAPQPAAGSVRLGPDPGEPVAGYLARLPAQLPAPGSSAPALVQLTAEVTTAEAAALAGGLRAESVVLRVPLPRVQTALHFEALDPGGALPQALDIARQRAAHAAAADAARLPGRAGAIAAAAHAALTAPGCACVLALVVEGDRAALAALAAQPEVRAVQAAPAGTTPAELALAPLLPEQTERADPPPDDGPVPGAR